MNRDTIAKVQALGFDVYMRAPTDSWLIFSDGKQIGYLQGGEFGGYTLSTIHKPNRETGTGFQVERDADDFDRARLEACFDMARWASQRERDSVFKYDGIDDYRRYNSFNAEYRLVPRIRWREVPEARYWDMLNILPPAVQLGHGFMVGEPWDHNEQGRPRFTAFVEISGGHFYECLEPLTVAEFKAITPSQLLAEVGAS